MPMPVPILLPFLDPLLNPTPPHRLLHHRLIRGLLPLLDLEQRIRADLIHRIPRGVDAVLLLGPIQRDQIDALLEPFILLAVLLQQDRIDPTLAQEITFHLLRGLLPRGRGGLVHPFDALLAGFFPRSLLEALEFLDLALLVALAAELLDAFALLEGALLLGPDALLVPDQRGVP